MMSDEDDVDVLTIEPHPDNEGPQQQGVTVCLEETIGGQCDGWVGLWVDG